MGVIGVENQTMLDVELFFCYIKVAKIPQIDTFLHRVLAKSAHQLVD